MSGQGESRSGLPPASVASAQQREREYVVLEEWRCYIEVIVTARNKHEAVEKAQEILGGAAGETMTLPDGGGPTGRYEAKRL